MLRNCVRVVGLVGVFLYTVGVQALGLGDVQLNSGLNEPLDAEIKLLNTGDLNASQIIVKLASPEDFARAGAERDFFLTNFKYKTKLDGQGSGVVKITTKAQVREPYLNFLLEAKWPSGKLVREYTLLVDLPTFKSTNTAPRVSQVPTQKKSSAATASRQAARPTQDRKTTPVFTSRDNAPGQQAATNDATVTTRKNDTLWNLALDVRPNRSVAPQKVMVAMQALNPDAFINNNINLLKTGAVLRIPSLEDIERIDNDRAQATVAEQNEQWRSTSGVERQLDATPARSEPEVAEQSSDSGRLRLTTSSSDDATASGGTDSDAEGDGLAAQLSAAEASVEEANAENIELRSKVDGLEAELLELKNKLEIRDSALAGLQNKKQNTQPAPVAADTEAVAESEQAKADVAATKAEAEPAVTEPDPTTPPADTEPAGLFDNIMDNPLFVGGLGALVLALLGGVFFARRRSTADEGFDVMAELDDEANAEASLEGAADDAESFAATHAEEDHVEAPQDFSEFELDSLDNEEAVESEIGDPVAEADIYMAYGRFPQAIELLNRALEEEPGRSDLRVKLIEVHMGAGARGAAEEQLAQLHDSGDSAAIAQALAFLGQDPAAMDTTIEQPELMDEFTQMLSENDAAEQPAQQFEEDATQMAAANEEFSGDLALADDESISSDTLTGEQGLSLDDSFDLELDLDDAVTETDEVALGGLELDLDVPESDTNMDIEAELSELSSDSGMGDNEIGSADDALTAINEEPAALEESASTAEFQPDLDLNVSEEELAELEQTLADQPEADETHAELDLIDAADETATKIDLARAYIDMGDTEGAKDILGEVLAEAENEQLQEAQDLLDRIA